MFSKKISAAAAITCMLLLSGCEKEEEVIVWTPQKTDAVSVDKQGIITEYITDHLDASYYSFDELKSMIESEVAAYNQQNGQGAVTMLSLTSENSEVKLQLVYQKPKDFAAFNNSEFYMGSLLYAQIDGYLFDTTFQKVKDGTVKKTGLQGSDVIKDVDVQVMVVKAPLEVHVPGTVTYISSNAEMLAADDVYATGKSEEETGLVLPSNTVYKRENISFAEQEAANRVYIVYKPNSN